jgi:hypothetical protein
MSYEPGIRCLASAARAALLGGLVPVLLAQPLPELLSSYPANSRTEGRRAADPTTSCWRKR